MAALARPIFYLGVFLTEMNIHFDLAALDSNGDGVSQAHNAASDNEAHTARAVPPRRSLAG